MQCALFYLVLVVYAETNWHYKPSPGKAAVHRTASPRLSLKVSAWLAPSCYGQAAAYVWSAKRAWLPPSYLAFSSPPLVGGLWF